VEGSCEQGNELLGSINVGKFLSSRATGSISGRAHLHGDSSNTLFGKGSNKSKLYSLRK
jgi:hypothetical protein